jgi:type III restriction enzyme
VVYEIAAELTQRLKDKGGDWSARHVLFPQVLEAVWQYLEDRVLLAEPELPLEEVALLKYR